MDWDKIKLGSWSAIGGALVTIYIGFNRDILPTPAASSAGREYSVACSPLASLKFWRELNRLCDDIANGSEVRNKKDWRL